MSASNNNLVWLRRFSKLTCFSTLLLIFVGGMVTSTGSGLAVPDWPLSYGTLFPPMVGGVFYEHGHRMVASVVGFFMLCLAIWLAKKEKRGWVKKLGFLALGAVIAQGLLGGLTVLLFLPDAISVSHGVLAQTFFILTILIAYSQSIERSRREAAKAIDPNAGFLKLILVFTSLIYIQLIIGAIMRHSGSGLAIPDFPKMGDSWIPLFNEQMLSWINVWRFEHNLDAVTMHQVVLHFIHRALAFIIALCSIIFCVQGIKLYKKDPLIFNTICLLIGLIGLQLVLGILTVLSEKHPHVTSLHVMTGASILGISTLLFLRLSPLSIDQTKRILLSST